MRLVNARLPALICFFPILVLGCKSSKEEPRSRSSYIIGDDNIRPLDATTAIGINRKIIQASVLIVTVLNKEKIKFCSGVLIKGESGIEVLTNHHCFADVDDKGVVSRQFHPDACNETQVYFGYTLLNNLKATKISCRKASLSSDPVGDIARFSLESAPPPDVETLELWTDPVPTEDRPAVIVHYPNRDSQTTGSSFSLTAGIPSASITIENCATKGAFPKGTSDIETEVRFVLRHTCDLVHGSSGSALVDIATSKILGINWGGIKLEYPTYTTTDNVATNSLYVLAFLNKSLDEYISTNFGKTAVPHGGVSAGSSNTNAQFDTAAPDANNGTVKRSKWTACSRVTSGDLPVPLNQKLLLLLITIPLLRGFS